MALIPSKGTTLGLTVSSVLSGIGQLISIDPPASKSESYDSTSLDQSGVGKTKDMTGYAESDSFAASMWWDPAVGAIAAIYAAIHTPAKTSFTVTFASTHAITFTCADLEIQPKVDMKQAVTADIKGGVDGLAVVT